MRRDTMGCTPVNGREITRTWHPPQEATSSKAATAYPTSAPTTGQSAFSPSFIDHSGINPKATSLWTESQFWLFSSGGNVETANTQMIFRAAAHRASSWRLDSCSLRSTEDTCVSTVLTEMNRSEATSL